LRIVTYLLHSYKSVHVLGVVIVCLINFPLHIAVINVIDQIENIWIGKKCYDLFEEVNHPWFSAHFGFEN